MIYAAYVRVSDKEQYTENQRFEMERYIHDKELVIYKWYEDKGKCGEIPFHKRPAGKDLIRDAQAKHFESVLVYKIARFSRTLFESKRAMKMLMEEFQLGFRSCTENIDLETPNGRLQFHITASIHEYDRDNILEQTRIGTDRIIREGKWPGGKPPYGYCLNLLGYLEILEIEAEVVREINYLSQSGLGTRAIAVILTSRGIPIPDQGRKKTRSLSGQWLDTTVGDILRNPVYKGEFIWGKTKVIRHEGEVIGRAKVPEEQWKRISVPAIITDREYDQSLFHLQRRRSMSTLHRARPYLLSGLIRCDICKRAYVGHGRKGRNGRYYYYYGCKSKWEPGPCCPNVRIPCDHVEGDVWEEICRFVADPGPVIQELKSQLAESTEELSAAASDLQSIDAQLVKKQRERDRLIALVTAEDEEMRISEEEFKRNSQRLKTEVQQLKTTRAQLSIAAGELQDWEQRIDDASHLLTELRESVGAADTATKQKVIALLVEAIWVSPVDVGERFPKPQATVIYRFYSPEARNQAETPMGNSEVNASPFTALLTIRKEGSPRASQPSARDRSGKFCSRRR